MKKFLYFIILISLFLVFANTASANQDRLLGRILIQVEENGEAWYLNPRDGNLVYLSKPKDAFAEMKKNSISISAELLDEIKYNMAPKMLSGVFINEEESIYYVRPSDLVLFEISSPIDAFRIIRNEGLGVKNEIINSLPKLNSEDNILDLSLYKNFNNWWGDINTQRTVVYSGTTTKSKVVGWYFTFNKIKILEEVIGESIDDNELWYKVDGGWHPGAFVHSSYVDIMKQPFPSKEIKIPDNVNNEEYWIDVDLSKKILTLFKYDSPLFSTYVAVGQPYFPTLTGTYRIQTKLLKARMDGGPPQFPEPYDLKDVPYTMYYNGSYAIHGTYWHDKFGSRQSHGCTNLTQGDAKYIFEHASPYLEKDKIVINSSDKTPGTIVFNHY